VEGRRMRVDTTVVESNIHYPTDASLLGDGVRVLTRTMNKITAIAGAAGAVLRDRSRSTQRCLIQIGRASRSRSDQGKQRLAQCYRRLLAITRRVVGQAHRFAEEVASRCKRSVDVLQQLALQGHRAYVEMMVPLVQQVMRQTRQRINHGNTHSPGKIVSLFEPHTEIIRKGKAGKPTEFGKMVKIQEAEQQIVTHYEVYDRRPADSDLLVSAVQEHQRQFGHAPRLVTADAGFFSAANEAAVHELGVRRVCMPNRSSKSPQRKQFQRKRWFRQAQRWRTGCEGRISLLKRRHGLNRCRYKGADGMKRWVGLGAIADNLINMGRALKAAAAN
jgi:transposase, IS5 family